MNSSLGATEPCTYFLFNVSSVMTTVSTGCDGVLREGRACNPPGGSRGLPCRQGCLSSVLKDKVLAKSRGELKNP